MHVVNMPLSVELVADLELAGFSSTSPYFPQLLIGAGAKS